MSRVCVAALLQQQEILVGRLRWLELYDGPIERGQKRAFARYNQSMNTKRQHTANFKAQVVQELLKEEKTIAQIAAEYEVHPTQLRRWKAIVVEGMPSLFDGKDSLIYW